MNIDIVNLIWELAAVIFAAGAVWSELKQVRKDIARLENKQDQYNHLQERVAKIEAHLEIENNAKI
jgi:uncharacterized membrane protein